jgi:hypothetical protein
VVVRLEGAARAHARMLGAEHAGLASARSPRDPRSAHCCAPSAGAGCR